ncbi:putative tonB protein [Neisseria meningitidis NM36]|nr:putative tonB protein [Neisseria meningitidis NM36]
MLLPKQTASRVMGKKPVPKETERGAEKAAVKVAAVSKANTGKEPAAAKAILYAPTAAFRARLIPRFLWRMTSRVRLF